jgi:hypothetical protein
MTNFGYQAPLLLPGDYEISVEATTAPLDAS